MRFALVFLVACGATTPHEAAQPRVPAGTRLEIKLGTPVTLADGTVVDVQNIEYLHLVESKNLSSCTLAVRRGESRDEVQLAREHGGADYESSGYALGWTFELVVADSYSKPARVVVYVRKP